jgi:hypothetical protein
MKSLNAIGILVALGLSAASLPATAEPAYFARAPVQAWDGGRFNIVRISTLNRFDAQRAMIENWTSTFPDDVAGLQSAIRSNHKLASALAARGVQIHHVIAIQQAFSGNLVFYLD